MNLFFGFLFIVLIPIISIVHGEEKNAQPNIIFILADDLVII